jgi:hypothetical protein
MVPRVIRQKCNYDLPFTRIGFEWSVWRANPLTVQVCVFKGADIADLGNLDSLTLTGRPSLTSGTNLFSHTVEAVDFGEPTLSTWNAGTAQHATFEVAASETNRAPVANGEVALHVVLTANHTTRGEITLAVGRLLIREDNNGEGYPPEINAGAHRYIKGVLSARKTHLILHDDEGEAIAWISVNALPLPTEAS